MIKLNTNFSNEEKKVIFKCAGNTFEVLSSIDGDSYVLNEKGDYKYNECFINTNVEFFAQQRYEKVIPYRIIKFYQYYLMNTQEEKDVWYRGRRDDSGNWEYECCSDSLEEAFDSL